MRRIVSFIIWIMIVAAVAHFLAIQQGSAQIDWLGWRITAPTSLLVAAMLVVIWAVLILDRLLSFVSNIPRRISGGFSSRRGRLGQRALALGMAAAAAGEGREAIKHARKSVHYLGHNVMTDLLMAQASSLSGNSKSAQRYFDALKANTDTAYFGHIGQMRLALEAGDEALALATGREALKLKPRSASIANAIFVMEAKQGHWVQDELGNPVDFRAITMDHPEPITYAYCSDTAYYLPLVDLIKGVCLLYHESTFLSQHEHLCEATKHSSARQAAEMALAAEVRFLLLGHYSGRYKDLTGFKSEASEVFNRTYLARENAIFTLEHGDQMELTEI